MHTCMVNDIIEYSSYLKCLSVFLLMTIMHRGRKRGGGGYCSLTFYCQQMHVIIVQRQLSRLQVLWDSLQIDSLGDHHKASVQAKEYAHLYGK